VGRIPAIGASFRAAALLSVAEQGNIRTTTLRAFTGAEMRTIIGKVG
jgi:uncharacterized protein with GYD domain